MRHTGELSKIFEIDRTTLNYYVKKGLVHPAKENNQYHTYSFSDSMALAYLRHYLGLGFRTEEIPDLFERGDLDQHLEMIERHQERLEEESRMLKLRQLLLGNLYEALSFIRSHPDSIQTVWMEPYTFIPKREIPEGSFWMDIFKMAPSIEFSLSLRPGEEILLPDIRKASGVSVKDSWLEELGLEAPKDSLRYPGQEKLLATFSLRGEHMAEDLKANLEGCLAALPQGLVLQEEAILYLFLTHYGQGEETRLECSCFFEIASDEKTAGEDPSRGAAKDPEGGQGIP